MIDIEELAPATPKTLQPGQFLVSLAARDRRPLLGARWETSNVLVDLESMTYLHPENCDYPAGYMVSDVRFEVEETTAILGNDDRPSGSLILLDGRVAIYLVQKVTERYVFAVDRAEQIPRQPRDTDLVFPHWRVLCGSEEEPIELFRKGPVRRGGTVKLSGV